MFYLVSMGLVYDVDISNFRFRGGLSFIFFIRLGGLRGVVLYRVGSFYFRYRFFGKRVEGLE